MRKIVGSLFVSLDGVVQAPGGQDEDKSGGFEFGGWLPNVFDEQVGEYIDKVFGASFDLLLGRRTYDIFAAYWPYAGGEEQTLAERLNGAAKYVVTGGSQPLDWQNSHRLGSIDAVADLKRSKGSDLIIQGSSTLYPQLLRAGLIDRLVLMTFPVVLGSGKRWFSDGTPAGTMRLVEHRVTSGGIVIATYEPRGTVETGGFGEQEPSLAEIARRKKVAEGNW